jgi:hypothetical protein
MKVVACQTQDYARVLMHVWDSDTPLLTHWHIAAPCDLGVAVAHTVAQLESDACGPAFAFYELLLGAHLVGFLGVDPELNFVITFGLRVGYRTPEIKEALWECIRTFTDDKRPVCCLLHSRNTRAQRFLEAGGAEVVDTIVYEGKAGKLYLLN